MSVVMHSAGWLLLNLPARFMSIDSLIEKLEKSGEIVAGRITNAPETYENHKEITHIVGIERWGQQRLKVALGEPFRQEEYDGYRPPKDTPWAGLKDTFEATRQQTLELGMSLKDCDPAIRINHNTYGPLSVRAWLFYLNIHANLTSRSIH